MSLGKVSNLILARLILRQLWQIQDARGISMGRSRRNCFLEGAIHLIPIPEYIHSDDFGYEQLLDEAQRRNPVYAPNRPFYKRNPTPKTLGNLPIAILLLKELEKYYEEDEAKNGPMNSITSEPKLCAIVIRLLPPQKQIRKAWIKWNPELLYMEARDRYSEIIRKQSEEHDRAYFQFVNQQG